MKTPTATLLSKQRLEAPGSLKICYLMVSSNMDPIICTSSPLINVTPISDTPRITHVFSTLCIHTINCCRTTSTTRKLAEHRARLCLLGLQELQKSWDLENWVLDLFFRCLDEGMACRLRGDPDTVFDAIIAKDDGRGGCHADTTEAVNRSNGSISLQGTAQLQQQWQRQEASNTRDISAPNDWYGLFNFTDDYTDVLGSSSQPDSLNLQNLEFLYRFL